MTNNSENDENGQNVLKYTILEYFFYVV